MRTFSKYFLPISAVVILSACSTSPLSRHPDIIERKKTFPPAIVMTDFVVIDALNSDTSKVDLVENMKGAKLCLNEFAGKLNQKGYTVDRTLISSVGLLMNQGQPYRVVKTPEEQQFDSDALSIGGAPFFIHELYDRDPTLRQHLFALYTSLMNSDSRMGEMNLMMPDAVDVGKAMGGGTLIIVLVGGFNVQIANQAEKYTPPPSLTFEKVAMQRMTQLSMRLYMIDAASGQIIWDNRTYSKGGIIHSEKILGMVDQLVEELP